MKSFEHLKWKMAELPIFTIPDFFKDFTIETYASMEEKKEGEKERGGSMKLKEEKGREVEL